MIELGVARNPEFDEYKVTWVEDGVFHPSSTYYTSDPVDAAITAQSLFDDLTIGGERVSLTKGAKNHIDRYLR